MTITTSYFALFKQLLSAGVLPVSISRFGPRWLGRMVSYKSLAPAKEWLKSPAEIYVPKFRELLSQLDAGQVMDDLKALAAEHNAHSIALCCYEKPTDFCHRHMVADWLYKQGAVESPIREFGVMDSERVREIQQTFWNLADGSAAPSKLFI